MITIKMLRYKVLFFLLLSFYYAQDINIPLIISGTVINSKGQYISEENFHFQIYLRGYPSYFLTENSPSCGYQPPVWFAEIGNLPIKWNFNDSLIIILEDYSLRERISYSWPIDSTTNVPDLQTQPIATDKIITDFKISDRGVINEIPLTFTFHSMLSQTLNFELIIINEQAIEVYKSITPDQVTPNDYQFIREGKSTSGKNLRSGIYFYFFKLNNQIHHSGIITLKNQ